ncbi:MAG: DUF2161 family putative PD-(D/E)XK-type phosphodiesterase [Marinibacterium sp.]|nr:DUF2161 family putative PD-(D/E)XK-type phosphodiesterase [Marinibacterium sp.]
MEREEDLYPPVKALLEARGYVVKGEVGAADVVARPSGGGDADDPVIVELKLRFSLSLFHQAIARQAVTDLVYVAVPKPTGRSARRVARDNLALCRRLGLGLIFVHADGRADVKCDPGPFRPRQSKLKRARLLRAFDRLDGDPNAGGTTRGGVVTVYRQDALRCARYLAEHGASRGAVVAAGCDVPGATTLMRTNHYGWFDRVDTGVYALNDAGRAGLDHWAHAAPDPIPDDK